MASSDASGFDSFPVGSTPPASEFGFSNQGREDTLNEPLTVTLVRPGLYALHFFSKGKTEDLRFFSLIWCACSSGMLSSWRRRLAMSWYPGTARTSSRTVMAPPSPSPPCLSRGPLSLGPLSLLLMSSLLSLLRRRLAPPNSPFVFVFSRGLVGPVDSLPRPLWV